MRDAIYKMITDIVDNAVDMCFSEDVDSEEWDLNEFNSVLRQIIPIEPLTAEKVKGKKKNEMKHLIKEEAVKLYEAKESEFPEPEQLRELERVISTTRSETLVSLRSAAGWQCTRAHCFPSSSPKSSTRRSTANSTR